MIREETWKSKLNFVRKSYFCMQNSTIKAILAVLTLKTQSTI